MNPSIRLRVDGVVVVAIEIDSDARAAKAAVLVESIIRDSYLDGEVSS